MTRSPHSWKALILAAGYGTRLLPHTRYLPKPLFTISNVPLLDSIIGQLAAAGCGGVAVNTHHLSEKVERHCHNRHYDIPVRVSHEPEILGTGGAMKNNAGFFGDAPFLVINGDIVTDISLETVRQFHAGHGHDVTLVMHDCERFNTVAVDKDNHVTRFYRKIDRKPESERLLAFTGIHVVHPRILDNMPETGVYADIIDVYTDMLTRGETIAAFVAQDHQWQDIGTVEAYQAIAFEKMTRQVLQTDFEDAAVTAVQPIASDGSDTRWCRIQSSRGSIVACNRGLDTTDAVSEAESFTRINRHLRDKKVAVPRVYLSDPMAGLAFIEDLGDTSLQAVVQAAGDKNEILRFYHLVIDCLLHLALSGADGFDDSWTYQTASYDRRLVLDRECRYFTGAFLEGYLGLHDNYRKLDGEFQRLADLTLRFAVNGLMHRDMQSRNIMLRNGQPYFIDVQGARRGPVQYDLAALLIDPYVSLPPDIQKELLAYYEHGVASRRKISRDDFRKGYACCTVTRNLQVLGAFGFLTREKQKTQFEPHIPAAARSLINNIAAAEAVTGEHFPELTAVAQKAGEAVKNSLSPPPHA